jgi:hypothetical protein
MDSLCAARTDWRAEAIFDALDTIKRRRLGLSATTNLAMRDLAAAIGDAALARIDAV